MPQTKARHKPMPQPVEMRVGCKVCWYYYKPEDTATIAKAVEVAEHNAVIDASNGFDFGYQVPGAKTLMDKNLTGEWAKYSGLVQVTTS